jgi:DNA-binding MarR family transcriptional regulator
MSRQAKRQELIAALGMAGRELSAHTVMFHAAVAERMQLGLTDHKAFDFILRHGPVTAGQLAEITGLTTGAVTGVIDRLEQTGYVERVRDSEDRRKVLVRSSLSAARQRKCCELFDSLGTGVARVAETYSERELEVILDFMRRSVALLHAETVKLLPDEQKKIRAA